MMNYVALSAEVKIDPRGIGYASMTDADAAEAMNDPSLGDQVLVPGTEIRTTDVYAALGLGATEVINALESSARPEHRHFAAMVHPSSVHGVDIGHPVAQALVGGLVGDGIMTQSQAAIIQALGKKQAARAEIIGVGPVSERDIARIREGGA